MTTDEFSNEFDVKLGLYGGLKLDEYEKSVFLTQAQEEFVIGYYSGVNPFGLSFEEVEEIRRYLDKLVKTYETEETVEDYDLNNISFLTGKYKSYFFELPTGLWYITYEGALLTGDFKCDDSRTEIYAKVYPVRQDYLNSILNNPFRGPSKDRVLRLDSGNNIVELISQFEVKKYKIRYLSKPSPIITTSLAVSADYNLSINGISVRTECELHEALHKKILDRAVQLALLGAVNKNNSSNKEQENQRN